MADPRHLRRALDDLRAALGELIDPLDGKVLRDGLAVTGHAAPSLLEQLRTEIAPSGAAGGGRRGSSGAPVALDVLDLLAGIEGDAVELHRRAMAEDTATAEERLRAVVAILGRSTDIAAIDRVTQRLYNWVHAIRDTLASLRRVELDADCPVCGARHIVRRENGEAVQVLVLVADPERGCTCRSCGARWPREQLEHLGRLLGCAPLAPSTDDTCEEAG